jgi:hypothetical protein
MIGHELREFVDCVLEKHEISADDLKMLQQDVLGEDLVTREVIDVLVALDRAVKHQAFGWADYLVALTVDFAVWTSRPTGIIDRDAAHWLVTTLSAGGGPTPTALRIAFEIVREADGCDEALLTFAMREGGAGARRASTRQDLVLLAS